MPKPPIRVNGKDRPIRIPVVPTGGGGGGGGGTFSATPTFAAGWSTFGQSIPSGTLPAGSGLQVGSLATQTDIKTTWPDGSAKFAVVSCKPTASGPLAVAASTVATGSFTPTVPTCVVTFTVNSQGSPDGAIALTTYAPPRVYTATLPGSVSSDLGLNGPLAKEWRWLVTPLRTDDSSNTAHGYLRVRFDVRVYSDGAGRVDVAVENCLHIAGATLINYSVAITVNGSSVYTHGSLNQYYFTRWRKVFTVGAVAGTVAPDTAAMVASGAVPKYMTNIVNQDYTPPTTVVGTEYDIMGRGAMPYDGMGAPGEDVRQGTFPWYVPQYMVYKLAGDLRACLQTGDLAGSWNCHLNDPVLDAPISIDAVPQIWFDPLGGSFGTTAPAGDVNATHRLSMDDSHTSSLAFFPYLVTGDRYYADEMRHWGAWQLNHMSPGYRNQGGGPSQGIFWIAVGQTRGVAWGWRDIGQPAAYLPDADPFKAYFASKLIGNLDLHDGFGPKGGLNVVVGMPQQPSAGVLSSTIEFQVATWQLGYVTMALEQIYNMGVVGVGTKGRTTEDLMASCVQQFFNNPGIMNPIYACVLGRADGSSGLGSGYIKCGTGSPSGGTWVYDPDLATSYAREIAPYTASLPPDYLNYGRHSALVLQVGARRGVAGCAAAHAWLISHVTGTFGALPDVPEYFKSAPGFAIDYS